MPLGLVAVLISSLTFLLAVFSFFFFRAYLRRRTGPERILAELREEVGSIVRSIDEATERDISLIEEREKKLKLLLHDVDKRFTVYMREMNMLRGTAAANPASKKQDSPESEDVLEIIMAPRPQAPSYQELGKNRHRLNAQDAPQNPNQPDAQAAQEKENSPAAKQEQPLTEGDQIRELVRAGFTPQVVAARLGISIAEVEVVAALMELRSR